MKKKNKWLSLSLLGIFIIAALVWRLGFSPSFQKNHRLPLPEMVPVAGGTFLMGATPELENLAYDNEKPAHTVTVDDFLIGKYAVTVAQFALFVAETGYLTQAEKGAYVASQDSIYFGSWIYEDEEMHEKFAPTANWRCDVYGVPRDSASRALYPVVHVSWHDANAYCAWLSRKEGKSYRLPTEAEWEYAARGGQLTHHFIYSGSNRIAEVGWSYSPTSKSLPQIGLLNPNELGIYDMSGTINEWCADWYGPYPAEPQVNSKGPLTGERRVARGGSWSRYESYSRVSNRMRFLPENRGAGLGFRVACSAEKPHTQKGEKSID